MNIKQLVSATVLVFALGWGAQVYAHGDEAVPMAGGKNPAGNAAPPPAPPPATGNGGADPVTAGARRDRA